MIEALYARHGTFDVEECDSVEEARGYLDSGSDAGHLFALAVYENGERVWRTDFGAIDDEDVANAYKKAKARAST